MNTVRFVKTQDAQPMGTYVPTAVDATKAAVDFRLISVGPYVIRWKNGDTQRVTERQLKTLQLAHTWATDF